VSIGEEYSVANHGANALEVYPASGQYIGTLAVNTAYSVSAGKFALFRYIAPGHWASCP
jgi:hypothetical protein